jgi:hypothetical protein
VTGAFARNDSAAASAAATDGAGRARGPVPGCRGRRDYFASWKLAANSSAER